jgi:hypothetical protein
MEENYTFLGLANEPWSDHPQCTCPTITAFMIFWNDSLPSDKDRDRLLKPLLTDVNGCKRAPRTLSGVCARSIGSSPRAAGWISNACY